MELTSPKTIKEILTQHDAKANKTLGQNFLTDKNVLQKIIEASEIKKTDTILEVGPGIGTLTQQLASRAGEVVAIEKDPAMCKILSETMAEFKNVTVVQDDILHNTKDLIHNTNYKVVANIPYYLTSPLIRKFLELNPSAGGPPEFMVLMIQKEVAQRICAKPPKLNLLAVSVQFYAEPKIMSYVSKNSFFPAPKIDSAIIKITPKNIIEKNNSDLFFKVVKAGFSHPRKQLLGNLVGELKIKKETAQNWLLQNNIKPTQRAETLSVEQWVQLAMNYELCITKYE